MGVPGRCLCGIGTVLRSLGSSQVGMAGLQDAFWSMTSSTMEQGGWVPGCHPSETQLWALPWVSLLGLRAGDQVCRPGQQLALTLTDSVRQCSHQLTPSSYTVGL